MKDISLKELLEAGCHFGHKVSKWHPKASAFIYQPREGIHIIDLAKTRDGLKSAGDYVKNLGVEGKSIIFVGTKRQAKQLVTAAAKKAGVSFLTTRWIGGFLTNWSEVKKNINKIIDMKKNRDEGGWKKFPKHEQVKMEKYLRQIEIVYGGVTELKNPPEALFIVDIKKEIIAVREAQRKFVTTIAIVDTNSDPNQVDYAIPANDDAVGSIEFITNYISDCYLEGKEIFQKRQTDNSKNVSNKAEVSKNTEKQPEQKAEIRKENIVKNQSKETVKIKKSENKPADEVKKIPAKRGRPKKK